MKALENAKKLYMEGIEQGNYKEAIYKYTNPPYRQHSTGVKTGQEGFIEFFSEFVKRCPDRKFEIINSFGADKTLFVLVKQTIDGQPSWITMDIFAADNEDKLIEHWDIIQKYQSEKQVEGNHTHDETENAQENNDYIQKNINELEKILDDSIIHSTNNWKQYKFEKIHQIVAQNNFVATLIELNVNEIPAAAMCLFRFEDGKVVEYWDALEPIPTPAEAKNDGKF